MRTTHTPPVKKPSVSFLTFEKSLALITGLWFPNRKNKQAWVSIPLEQKVRGC